MATEREIDRVLVERVQQGDKTSFDILVSKYQRKLFRLVLRFVHNQSEAEDVVQETFIKAYRALHQFRGDAAFYTWIYRIGINTARNFLDNRGRRVPTSTDMTAEQMESFSEGENLRDINTPESVLASKQIAETVNLAMNELPDDLRSALMLREIEGLSYEEIAIAMACPIGTVRSRIFRAREAVAVRLRPLLGTDVDRRW
ncbi:RNA polymerase sigma factor RpoE [Oxalobacter vibrioformis]|uniref:RNA polymerase sigma factor n=1 Tax=Oxalobacter vibrioformis TaxID=933080 RepID=A0A9E9P504_9BURK|nr:RNA polymerase sigma factor RpoE [Oxalobacter vibrioformis]NLC24977.1 RNA polymerase sigma factor RpoE [Oxalobacter sp.]WAW10636.1 RNA polymerase sigma factor RpoE [Oxalobacter vibrioformis]